MLKAIEILNETGRVSTANVDKVDEWIESFYKAGYITKHKTEDDILILIGYSLTAAELMQNHFDSIAPGNEGKMDIIFEISGMYLWTTNFNTEDYSDELLDNDDRFEEIIREAINEETLNSKQYFEINNGKVDIYK